jgi:hypothetical protein
VNRRLLLLGRDGDRGILLDEEYTPPKRDALARRRAARYRHVRAFDVEDLRLTGVQRPRTLGVVRLKLLSFTPLIRHLSGECLEIR